MRNLVVFLLGIAIGVFQTGCAPVLVGAGVSATAIIADDRRTSGAMLEDKTIEIKAQKLIAENLGEKNQAVKVHSYNRYTLLVGQVDDEQKKIDAEDLTMEVSNVREVQNEIEVAGQPSLMSRQNDGFLKARVVARLVKDKKISSNHIKVITSSGIVYLMGLVTNDEGNYAAKVSARTEGVKKVVTVFEYID